ncbi:hypothetical protein NT2_01_06380 [Caenibius tardaugens NBRC 16725]|uniref:Dodecin n=1 Tax=Caenibius tardaugens NBRC 16725 TaxID=1219035 RepID=U2ZR88_9SPHN|nr:dodecin [Caenibius tardaugens]AZI36928.1 hypothetical protein EGO55_13955 [Caenibius tardaugens NBRC 16725]GAD47864.1 hypothetical protein NT2_01_06380 [Caenibius tardaugens NBRC 16725]
MEHHVFKLLEIVGTSGEGIDGAVKAALARARETVRHVRWFEVTAARGFVHDSGEIEYQVTLKIGFAIDD